MAYSSFFNLLLLDLCYAHRRAYRMCAAAQAHRMSQKHRKYRIFLFLWVCIFKWCLILIVKSFSFFSLFGE